MCLDDKYKKIKDRNKATGRGRDSFEFFEDLDSILGCRDKISPRYMCQSDICTKSPDRDSSRRELTYTSRSARSYNSDGEELKSDDKATQTKLLEDPPIKSSKAQSK